MKTLREFKEEQMKDDEFRNEYREIKNGLLEAIEMEKGEVPAELLKEIAANMR